NPELSGATSLPGDSEDIAPRQSGRHALIEEGVIDRRIAAPRADSDGGFSDDKTALADDNMPHLRDWAAEEAANDSHSDGDIDDPEMDHEPREPTPFDDSKTEWAPDARARPDHEPSDEDSDNASLSGDNEQTWIPPDDALPDFASRPGKAGP